jgi:hypothetical protein
MNRLAVVTFVVVGALVAACGGTAATAQPTPGGGTQSPGGGTPLVTPSPSGALPATPTFGGTNEPPLGNLCAGYPTLDPSNPYAYPSSPPDPTLEAHFPTEIDGNPVTDLNSTSWAAFACLGSPDAVNGIAGQVGFDLTKLTEAQANATVDDQDVEIDAFRLPGGDGNQIVTVLAQLAAASGSSLEAGTLGQATAGGKSVITYTDSDGVSYGIVLGDTLIFAGPLTQSQADKIFAAIK